jgi:Tol biopolymer transport system component
VYLRFVEGSGLHLFVYDMATAVHTDVTWVVGGIHGRPEPYDLDISADGQSLVFGAVARNETTGEESQQTDIFLYDGQTGAIELISAGADAGSFDPAISADGSFIVFASRATNLVSGDTNQTADIFLYDQQTGQMERINLPPGRLSAK